MPLGERLKESALMGQMVEYVLKTNKLNCVYMITGKEVGRVGVTYRNFPFARHIFCSGFCLGVFLSVLHQQTHTHRSPLCTTFHCPGEKKTYLKCHWNCSERFGVRAQRKPLCMFTALSLAKVRPPLLDKCKAFSALSTSCWPVSVQ